MGKGTGTGMETMKEQYRIRDEQNTSFAGTSHFLFFLVFFSFFFFTFPDLVVQLRRENS